VQRGGGAPDLKVFGLRLECCAVGHRRRKISARSYVTLHDGPVLQARGRERSRHDSHCRTGVDFRRCRFYLKNRSSERKFPDWALNRGLAGGGGRARDGAGEGGSRAKINSLSSTDCESGRLRVRRDCSRSWNANLGPSLRNARYAQQRQVLVRARPKTACGPAISGKRQRDS
jgi:hypothetical protein